MNTSESAHSAPATHLPARNLKHLLTRRRLIATACLFILMIAAVALYQAAPANQLAWAQARWAANGYAAYRIAVKYEVPLYQCEQDFEVRDGAVSYRHEDGCSVSPVNGAQGGLSEPMMISKLFRDIEDTLENPTCGPQGCLCDGPLGADVIYNAERGYPEKIVYRLMPDVRWRDPNFWIAQLTGKLSCLSSGKGSAGTEQTITVTALTPLKDQKPPTGGLGSMLTPEATKPILPND